MSDPSEIPPEHLWITTLIARGMARADEEAIGFHRGGQPEASEAERALHREYLEEAHEVLRATGRLDELALMEKLVQGASEKPRKKMSVDELEAWIAEREEKVSRIEHHLHIWDRGGFEGRDSDWADRARKAVEYTGRQIRFGYNLRLNLTREAPEGAARGLRDRLAAAEAGRDRERRKREHLVGRQRAETDALKAFLRSEAPHLLGRAHAACDAAIRSYDEERSTARAPERRRVEADEGDVAEPEPSP